MAAINNIETDGFLSDRLIPGDEPCIEIGLSFLIIMGIMIAIIQTLQIIKYKLKVQKTIH